MATDPSVQVDAVFDNASEWPDFDGYEPLEQKLREIRVLDLHRDGSHVACTIRHVALDDQPQYSALSYCWGAPVPKEALKPLQINGQVVMIRPTLYYFLHNILLHFEHLTVWLDVICINQKDVQERASQVLLMSSIYASASSVLAWLGLSDDDTNFVFNNLPSISNGTATTRNRRLFLEYTEQFFLKPYWTRRWVLQEFALGEPIHLMCGSNIMTWLHLVDGLSAYGSFPNSDAWSRYEAFKQLKSQRGPASDGIVPLLIRFQKWRNVDPRDTVFALCSLAKDSNIIDINYERPSADLFFDIAARILTDRIELDQHVIALRKSMSFSIADLICSLRLPQQRYHEIGIPIETLAMKKANNMVSNSTDAHPCIQYPAFAHRCRLLVETTDSATQIFKLTQSEYPCSHECGQGGIVFHPSVRGKAALANWSHPTTILENFPFQNGFGLVFSIKKSIGHPIALCLKTTELYPERLFEWLAEGIGIDEWGVLQKLCINGIVRCKRDYETKPRFHVTSLVLTLIWLWGRGELLIFWKVMSELPADVIEQNAECLCEQRPPTNLVAPLRTYYKTMQDTLHDVPFVNDSEEFKMDNLRLAADAQHNAQRVRPRYGDISSILPQAENLWRCAVNEWLTRKNLLPLVQSNRIKLTVSLPLRSRITLWKFEGGPLPVLRQYMPPDWQQTLPQSVEVLDVNEELVLTLSCEVDNLKKTMCIPLQDVLVAVTEDNGLRLRWPTYAAIEPIRDDYNRVVEQVCWKERGGLTRSCRVVNLDHVPSNVDSMGRHIRGRLLHVEYERAKGRWEPHTLVVNFNESLYRDSHRHFELCTIREGVSMVVRQ